MKRINHFIFEEYRFQAEHLGLFRICYALFSIFVIGIPDFRILHTLPDFIYDPPMLSIASFSSGFPEYTFLLILSIALFILHFAVLFGYKTKTSSICLTLLLLTGYSFYFSMGKINHGSMITVWIPLLMGLAGWGQAFSIDACRGVQNLKIEGQRMAGFTLGEPARIRHVCRGTAKVAGWVARYKHPSCARTFSKKLLCSWAAGIFSTLL
jgi:uncharacterized membrane protein YphA (DoxX/SURF4 family)